MSASLAARDPANVVLACQSRAADPEVLVGGARHTGTLVLDALLDTALAVTVQTAGTVVPSVSAHLALMQQGVAAEHENGCEHGEKNGRNHILSMRW